MPRRPFLTFVCLLALILPINALAQTPDIISFREFFPLLTSIALPGYTAAKPTGSTMKQPMANSEAQINFEKGDKHVEVSIYDGPGSLGMIASMQGMIEIETNDESIKSVNFKGYKGFEMVRAEAQEVEYMVGVANRFTVFVRGSGPAVAADARKALDLLDLAKLAGLAGKQ